MAKLETIVEEWKEISDILSAGGSATDLSVSQRTFAGVKAAIAADVGNQAQISYHRFGTTYKMRTNALRLRCSGVTADTVCTYNLYVGTLKGKTDCDLTFLGTLSFTIGTQGTVVANYEFADQVSVTEGDTIPTWKSKSAADERVAEAGIDLTGEDLIVIVPTAVGSDCKLFGKGY